MGELKMLEEIDNLIEEYMSGYVPRGMQDFCAGMKKAQEIIRKHMTSKDADVPVNDGWIPVKERLPEDDKYILLSFENFSLPMVGRYDTDAEGGAFYLGDCNEEDTCISMDLFVNAWMPLPEPYRPETAI